MLIKLFILSKQVGIQILDFANTILAWPCMSFSILRDSLGDNRTDFPMQVFLLKFYEVFFVQMYLVSGSHADKPKNAEISVIGLKNLTGTKQVSNLGCLIL